MTCNFHYVKKVPAVVCNNNKHLVAKVQHNRMLTLDNVDFKLTVNVGQGFVKVVPLQPNLRSENHYEKGDFLIQMVVEDTL